MAKLIKPLVPSYVKEGKVVPQHTYGGARGEDI
jgi:hypothetical protein